MKTDHSYSRQLYSRCSCPNHWHTELFMHYVMDFVQNFVQGLLHDKMIFRSSMKWSSVQIRVWNPNIQDKWRTHSKNCDESLPLKNSERSWCWFLLFTCLLATDACLLGAHLQRVGPNLRCLLHCYDRVRKQPMVGFKAIFHFCHVFKKLKHKAYNLDFIIELHTVEANNCAQLIIDGPTN